MAKVLSIMVETDEYLIAEGLSVWVGDHQTSRPLLKRLLLLCCLKEDSTSKGSVEIYWANGEAKALLTDPDYVPMILREL